MISPCIHFDTEKAGEAVWDLEIAPLWGTGTIRDPSRLKFIEAINVDGFGSRFCRR